MRWTAQQTVWGLIILAAVLRFFTLGDRPFDGDEGVILKLAELPIPALLTAVAVDVHPPFYHLLVHGVLSIFGIHEWSVRLVGVLAGIGLVALAPSLGSTLRIPGWVLGVLLATSPYLVNLSQDARMYSLLVFETTALWLVTVRLSQDRSGSWVWWLGWSLLALSVVSTHHIGWLVVGLMGGRLLFCWKAWRTHWQLALSTQIVLVLGYLPLLPLTLAQVRGRFAEQSITVGFGESVSGVIGGLYRMLAGRTFLEIDPSALVHRLSEQPLGAVALFITLFVPLCGLLVGVVQRSRAGSASTTAQSSDPFEGAEPPSLSREALSVIGLSLLVALFVGSIGTQASRYLSYLAPLLFGFLALGLIRSWPTVWGKAVVVVTALTFLAGLGTQYFRHNQAAGDDVYATTIAEQFQPGDVVLLRGAFAGGESRAFRYYLDRIRSTSKESSKLGHQLRGELDSLPIVDLFAEYDVRKSNLDELRAVLPAAKAAELLSQPGIQRVWYFDNTYQEPTLLTLPVGFQVKVMPLFRTDKEGIPLLLSQMTRKERNETSP